MPVVVVESPAKAKTINKYLGKDFTVLASYGHVRDLPPKDGSVLPDEDFDMKWEIAADSRKHVQAIAAALNIGLNLALIQVYGLVGVAYIYILTEAVLMVGYLAFYLRWQMTHRVQLVESKPAGS